MDIFIYKIFGYLIMTRKEELLQIINKRGSQNDIKAAKLIDEM